MTTTQQKKSRRKLAQEPAASAADAGVIGTGLPESDRHLIGDLPGQDRVDYFYEERIADWLGMPRKRIIHLRRRALKEGPHWTVRGWQVVYTEIGLQRLRDLLGDTKPAAVAGAEEPAAPVGPIERKKLVVVRVFPNGRLLQAKPAGEPGALASVLVKVRDNTNFMVGMPFDAVHDPRSASWQFVGRMPRRKGKW